MIKEIRFKNYRVLKDAQLKLGPFTLIVGPNGSGKTTIFNSLTALRQPGRFAYEGVVTAATKTSVASATRGDFTGVKVEFLFDGTASVASTEINWDVNNSIGVTSRRQDGRMQGGIPADMQQWIQGMRTFSLDSSKIAEEVAIQPKGELDSYGGNLAAVLDYIRDRDEESFNALRSELRRWLPEYDAILFQTPQSGMRSFQLRQAASGSLISARNLSDGTLMGLCVLALAYHPEPPTLVCFEEPEKGFHPRMLGEVRDALYRLAFPKECGISREPVQVIATTHSPLFVNLFKDYPEQLVIAEKQSDGTAKFKNLSDEPDLHEILGDAPLGDVWYTGILGGVPAR